jgi:hypothetical protein
MNEKCPYSKNGKCKSCKVLSIDCDGEKFHLCTQYELTSGKITNEELIREANTY